MSDLSDNEKTVLQQLFSDRSFLWSALHKFFAARADAHESMCSGLMRSVPRQHESASDYAARADENRLTMPQLESFAREL